MKIVINDSARLTLQCPAEIADFEAEQVERFAACFRSVWATIPQKYSDMLIESWKPLPDGPSLWLRDVWVGQPDGSVGSCSRDGAALDFLMSAVLYMPHDVIRALIAHELGHSFVAACRQRVLPDDLLVYTFISDQRDEEEGAVAKILGFWHFSQETLDRWLRESVPAAFFSRRRQPTCTLAHAPRPDDGSELSLEILAERVLRKALEAGSLDAAKFIIGGQQRDQS